MYDFHFVTSWIYLYNGIVKKPKTGITADKGMHYQRTRADHRNVLKYLEHLRTIYWDNTKFICSYETGCPGYTLYHQLTSRNVEIIARCLAQHNYSPVYILTANDEETNEFLRMRDDHKLAFKKVKQQILAFCLRLDKRIEELASQDEYKDSANKLSCLSVLRLTLLYLQLLK